jgi:GT2 family glycosyltransferase
VDAERWRDAQRRSRRIVRDRRHAARPVGAGEASGSYEPLASVIVVCWNSAKVLGRCLGQLLAQDYPNYEVIVVDDGSEDETVAIAQRAARSNDRLKLVRSAANRGCPHARNMGLREARGEVLAFVDADGYAACDWLTAIMAAFDADETIGGVASTVFFDANPMVLNGAGGTVNRQGWAADLCMNESYERAHIPTEALYPMGCGMAFRRAAVECVGQFDDRMLNYYDDVDYGIRVWRAGYRVVVAPDAWVDHGFGQAGGESARKALLCERHRMRVVLKHVSSGEVGRWASGELTTLRRAPRFRRLVKLRAMAWNVCHLPSVLVCRRRLRGEPLSPERLVGQGWGDEFPAGVPPMSKPRPDKASAGIEMADPRSAGQLPYGWFPRESVGGRSYRWAGLQAAAMIRLEAPARRLRLDYSHVPVDIGGVELLIRRLDGDDPLTVVWSTELRWQFAARSIENHPLALPAGDYEALFSAAEGWPEPPLKTRALSLALSSLSFERDFEIEPGGLDMSLSSIEGQLVSGWYEAERIAEPKARGGERAYRWATDTASAVVRLHERVGQAALSYRMPPGDVGPLTVSLRSLDGRLIAKRELAAGDDWRTERFGLALAAGEYVVSFETATTWSNHGGADNDAPPENRALGFALSSLELR